MKLNRGTFYVLVTALCCMAVVYLSCFSEKSDILNGVGSDGIYYARFTPGLDKLLKNGAFMSQPVDRLLPLGIAHLFYTGFLKQSDTPMIFTINNSSLVLSKNVVAVYTYLNTIYLLLAIIIWAAIHYRIRITGRMYVLSQALLFGNFMFLKQFFFEPVFLDQFVFLFGILLLYAVVFKKHNWQMVLLVASLFVNKLAAVVTIATVFFNHTDVTMLELKLKRSYVLVIWLAAYLAMSIYIMFNPLCTEQLENGTWFKWLPMSVLAGLLYAIYIGLRALPEYIEINLSGRISKFIALLTGVGLYVIIVKFFTVEDAIPMCENLKQNMFTEVLNFIRQANSRPLGFLSSHYNYLGILILLLFLFTSRITVFLNANPGWTVIFLCFFLASYSSESRYLTFFMPFITWMLVASPGGENDILKNNMVIGLVAVAGLLWSGFYCTINPLGTELYYSAEDVIYPNLLREPLQKYFRHIGPTTNDEFYLVQLAVFGFSLFVGYLLLLFLKRDKPIENGKLRLS